MATSFEKTTKTAWWVDTIFYGAEAVLLVVVFLYLVLAAKVFFQDKKLGEIESKIASYGTSEQRAAEKQVFDHKDRIDNFANLLDHHKISSNVFNFLEANTLSNVWFSHFTFSQESADIKLAGEAQTMEAFSNQLQALESSPQYVKSINVIDSKVAPTGKVSFIINVSLYPAIFSSDASITPVIKN